MSALHFQVVSFRKSSFPKHEHRAAFTAIELLFVLIIISIVGLMAAPRFANSLAEQRVDAAARRMAADIALAQRRAKFSSTSQAIAFDVTGNSYVLTGVADPDHPANPYTVALTDEPYESVIVSADFGGDAEIIFDGYGIPDTAGTLVVRAGSHYKTLTLNVLTGRVTITDAGSPDPPMLPK